MLDGLIRIATGIKRIYGIEQEKDAYAIVLGHSVFLLILFGLSGPYGTYHHFEDAFERLYFWGSIIGLSIFVGFVSCKIAHMSKGALWNVATILLSFTAFMVIWVYVIKPCSVYDNTEDVTKAMFAFNGMILHMIFSLPMICCTISNIGKKRGEGGGGEPACEQQPIQRRKTEGISGGTGILEPDCPSNFRMNSSSDPEGEQGFAGMELAAKTEDPCDELIRTVQLSKLELGGQIMCVSAEDHYVRLHGRKCSKLILSRFSDATDAVSRDVDGLQVHRSWWVAKSAIASWDMQDGSMKLILKNEEKVPVSRKYHFMVQREFPENKAVPA